jgi:hypothetical protein
MPFVRILWKPDTLDEAGLTKLRDASPGIVGDALHSFDPANVVRQDMVDVRIEVVGQLDLVHPDLLISVYARYEEARSASRHRIIDRLTRSFVALGVPRRSMIELVLSERVSTFEYEYE